VGVQAPDMERHSGESEATVITLEQPARDGAAAVAPRWRLTTRIAFRFSFIYFGLYILLTQMMSGLLPFGLPPLVSFSFVNAPVMWVIRNVFHDTRQLAVVGGSGDKMFDWVFALCLVAFSAVATLVWSVFDRRRPNYVRLHKWFRLYLRFGLATTMVGYGMAKFIPLQMPAPQLTRLLEPFGNFSPMGVLWYSIGASFPYERIIGSAELLAAVFLFIPSTVTLGGVISLIDSLQIFALNMTYDVPVKLFSFHLVLLSVLILAPDVRRLLNVLLLNRPAPVSTVPPLGGRQRAIRAGVALQVLLGVFFLWRGYSSGVERWNTFGAGAPKPPLYGIWVVDRMTIDGVERAPLVTDLERWRRVVIQTSTNVSFWRMDDTAVQMAAHVDTVAKAVHFRVVQGEVRRTIGSLAYNQPSPDRLILDGTLNNRRIRMETHLFPRENFLLVSRGFNWIQEVPFNR
jgi:hypothetical protein